MCRVHYARWYRTGRTDRTQRDYNDGRSIFEHAVEKMLGNMTKLKNGCWVYRCKPASNGYSRLVIHRGGDDGAETTYRWLCHRLSYEHFKGPIPEGMLVCHKCDNRRCCNPDHLFLGSYADNLGDMARKDRSLFGERANNVKLTEKQVEEAYRLRNKGLTYREIGERFGVTYGCIHMICAGHNWQRTYRRLRQKRA